MTNFENLKQQYLNSKEVFDNILNPKNHQYLIEYLGESETKILKLVFESFIERLNNHQKGLFHSRTILTSELITNKTGLSYYLQRKAITKLENYFDIINYTYVFTSGSLRQCRAFEINFKNLWNFYHSFGHFKYTSNKIKKLNKEQLIQYILKNEDRLFGYDDEEEEELL